MKKNYVIISLFIIIILLLLICSNSNIREKLSNKCNINKYNRLSNE